ncbi:hypothetical protein Tco_0668724 [Tanacetum coccineum]
MDSLHEVVKMTTQENTEVIKAVKALAQNLALDFKKEIEKMSQDLLSARKFLEDEIFTTHEKIDNAIKECQSNQKNHNDGSTSCSQGTPFSPLKVPKLDMYNGTRNATLVILFGLEQYFEAIGVVEDVVKGKAPFFDLRSHCNRMIPSSLSNFPGNSPRCIEKRNVKTLDEVIAATESIVDYSNLPRRPLAEEVGVERVSLKRLDG